MTTDSLPHPPPLRSGGALLIACGYLGAVMTRTLARGTVTALTRTTSRHPTLTAAGVRCIACDLALPDLAAQLAPALRGFVGSVFLLAPPSAWSQWVLLPLRRQRPLWRRDGAAIHRPFQSGETANQPV